MDMPYTARWSRHRPMATIDIEAAVAVRSGGSDHRCRVQSTGPETGAGAPLLQTSHVLADHRSVGQFPRGLSIAISQCSISSGDVTMCRRALSRSQPAFSRRSPTHDVEEGLHTCMHPPPPTTAAARAATTPHTPHTSATTSSPTITATSNDPAQNTGFPFPPTTPGHSSSQSRTGNRQHHSPSTPQAARPPVPPSTPTPPTQSTPMREPTLLLLLLPQPPSPAAHRLPALTAGDWCLERA